MDSRIKIHLTLLLGLLFFSRPRCPGPPGLLQEPAGASCGVLGEASGQEEGWRPGRRELVMSARRPCLDCLSGTLQGSCEAQAPEEAGAHVGSAGNYSFVFSPPTWPLPPTECVTFPLSCSPSLQRRVSSRSRLGIWFPLGGEGCPVRGEEWNAESSAVAATSGPTSWGPRRSLEVLMLT